jgi:hypothetical protein
VSTPSRSRSVGAPRCLTIATRNRHRVIPDAAQVKFETRSKRSAPRTWTALAEHLGLGWAALPSGIGPRSIWVQIGHSVGAGGRPAQGVQGPVP